MVLATSDFDVQEVNLLRKQYMIVLIHLTLPVTRYLSISGVQHVVSLEYSMPCLKVDTKWYVIWQFCGNLAIYCRRLQSSNQMYPQVAETVNNSMQLGFSSFKASCTYQLLILLVQHNYTRENMIYSGQQISPLNSTNV